jgi:hypothetical protein
LLGYILKIKIDKLTPKIKGKAILVKLIIIDSYALFLMESKSNSIPTTYINKINPIWLKIWIVLKELGGKSMEKYSGKKPNKKDGPKNIPPMTSPTTDGCRKPFKMKLKTRDTNNITNICISNNDIGCRKPSLKVAVNSSFEFSKLRLCERLLPVIEAPR